MVPVRYQLFSTWAQPSSEPAVLFTVCCFSLLEPQQPKPGSPGQGPGRQCQLHFPSCCLREEPIFPSLQHNKGFWLFSASLAIAWDQTPTRLGVVHILAEQSMPLATYIFFSYVDGWMQQANKESRRWQWEQNQQTTGEKPDLTRAGQALQLEKLVWNRGERIKLPWTEERWERWTGDLMLWKYRVVTRGAQTPKHH